MLAGVVHKFPLGTARQVQIAHEYVAGIETTCIVITLGPTSLVPRASGGTRLCGMAARTRSASEIARMIIAFAPVRLGLPPVVIVMAVVWRTAAASTPAAAFDAIVRPRMVIAGVKNPYGLVGRIRAHCGATIGV